MCDTASYSFDNRTQDQGMTPIQTPTEYLRDRISELRADRDLSQQELSDRLIRLGLQLDRSAVTKVEKGTRGVSLNEAIGCALAREAPLLSLLFPAGDQRIRLAKADTPAGL